MDLDELEAAIMRGLELTRVRLIAYKRYKGTPIVVMHEGRILHVSPDEYERGAPFDASPLEEGPA